MREKIERVQRKFQKFLSFQLNLCTQLSYTEQCDFFNLQPLHHRRNIFDLTFLNKVFNQKVDCPPILSCVSFYVPSRSLRRRDLFYIVRRINVRKNSHMVRTQALANTTDLDVFIDPTTFKRNAKRFYNNLL